MARGVKALAMTNPEARYVVLTDKKTAPHLEKHFDVRVTAPDDTPLMMAGILAQKNYTKRATDELTIHAAPDCMVARPLSGVWAHPTHGMAITYRRPPEPINNVAYVRDHDLAHWFLKVAAEKLEELRGTKVFDWGGDQAAWYATIPEPWETLPADMGFHGLPESTIKVAHFGRSKIYLYTCTTHNHFVRNTGDPKRLTRNAFMLHFKGPRKRHMAEYLYKHIPYWRNIEIEEEDESSADWIQRLLGGKTGKSTEPGGTPGSRLDRHEEREGT